MAFQDLYVRTGGNNMNSGDTNTDAPSLEYTNGNWDAATGVFLGDFSSVSVGRYAAVYNDGATTPVFIGEIITITTTGTPSCTISLTNKYGTAPTTSATGRTIRVGGAWADVMPVATAILNGTTVFEATRINIPGATFIQGTNRTLSQAGTTTLPLWYRGYQTTPGDLDASDDVTVGPLFNFSSTFALTTTGAHARFSSIRVTGSRTAGNVWAITTGTNQAVQRCRIENSASGASVVVLNATVTTTFDRCYFTCPTNSTAIATCSSAMQFTRCRFVSGNHGLSSSSSSFTTVHACVFSGQAGDAIRLTASGGLRISSCTISEPGSDGIEITTTPIAGYVIDTLFRGPVSGIGINNSSGANTNMIYTNGNSFYNTATPYSGFGDAPATGDITESSDPCVSDSDLRLVSNALSRGVAITIPGESWSTYLDKGGVQHQDAGGGGTTFVFMDG